MRSQRLGNLGFTELGQDVYRPTHRLVTQNEGTATLLRLDQAVVDEQLLSLADCVRAWDVVVALQVRDRRQLGSHGELAGVDAGLEVGCDVAVPCHGKRVARQQMLSRLLQSTS
jgi:hypothetical protein